MTLVLILSKNLLKVNLSSKVAPKKTGFASNGMLIPKSLKSNSFGLVEPL